MSRRNVLYVIISASLLSALFSGRAIFFNLAYLFVGVLLLAFLWSWFAIRGIAMQRVTRTHRAQVGRTFQETFYVRNLSLLPKLWLEVRDHSDLPGHRASHVVPTLAPRGRYSWHANTYCEVRGEFLLGPMTILSGDPFGLYLAPRRINAQERVIVYPATVDIQKFSLPAGVLSGGDAQRQLTHHVTTNAVSVREYVSGDSINRIHWKSSAKRGKLIVKEFELDPLVDIWLFVDLSAESLYEEESVQRRGGIGTVIPTSQLIPASTEEYSVVIAASLASHFIEIERALGFVAYIPHREVYQPERGNRQLTNIMEAMAVARSLSERTLYEMLSLEMHQFSRGATLLLITASQDIRWLSQVQMMMQRGVRPLCIYIDAASFGKPNATDTARTLLYANRIPTIIIQKGDNLSQALQQRPHIGR